jgi:endonuclease/exonuclease/phosphatase family metal-dependent hydrolase
LIRRIAVLALVSWLMASCGPVPHRPAETSVLLPCAHADCLRAVTWNLHAIPLISPRPAVRLRNVAQKLHEQQPDVVMLQEVWSYAYARQLARDLAGEYRLTTAAGCGRPFPCGGLAILVRSASGWVASAPTFVAYEASAPWYRWREWDFIAKKGVLTVQLARGDARLAIADTHLQTEYARYGRDYSDLRRAQLEQLEQTLQRSFGATPVLLGGDFNTAPAERSGLYESHVAPLGVDCTVAARAACGECGSRPGLPHPGRWLDYLITRRFAATVTIERLTNEAVDQPFSDHEGVLGRFDYAPSALR